MSVLTEMTSKVDEAVDEIKGWVEETKNRIPAVVAEAQKVESNPLYKAAEALPEGHWLQLAADLVTKLADYANGITATPPAAVAAAPAEPDTQTVTETAAAADAPAAVQPPVVQVPAAAGPTTVAS